MAKEEEKKFLDESVFKEFRYKSKLGPNKIRKSKDGHKFYFEKRSWLHLVEVDDNGTPLNKDEYADIVECEVKQIKKRQRRVTGAYQSSKRVEAGTQKPDIRHNDVSVLPPYSPELDTVRIFFPCASYVDLYRFIPETATKTIKTCWRSPNGDISPDNEFYRNEFANSWYGKMQISREIRKYGQNGKYCTEVLCFEYSVAKWYNFTNGTNSGMEPSSAMILYPCIDALRVLHIEDYFNNPRMTIRQLAKELSLTAEIRRFDLSLNMRVPALYRPVDYIELLSRCMVNRQEAKRESDGSISFGSAKTPYRVIWYDKEKEQKDYFNRKDPRPAFEYVDYESGEVKRFDFNEEKTKFYTANKDCFKNIIRFEIQFRTKFIQDRNIMSVGQDNIDNVLRIGAMYWRDILNRFDEQLGRANFEPKDGSTPIENVLDILDSRTEAGVYSPTVSRSMQGFLLDCYRKGWDVVRKNLGPVKFCQQRKRILDELNYDVKVALPKTLPIMRIMPTVYLSRQSRMIRDFRLIPAPVYKLAT